MRNAILYNRAMLIKYTRITHKMMFFCYTGTVKVKLEQQKTTSTDSTVPADDAIDGIALEIAKLISERVPHFLKSGV